MRRILLKSSAAIWDFNPLRADAHADIFDESGKKVLTFVS